MHKSTLFLAFLMFMTSITVAQTNDLAVIRQRVIAELFTNTVADNQVETILAKMREDGSFPGIDYADLSTTAGFPQQRHIGDLLYLARVYQSKTSKYYHSKQLMETIEKGLRYWAKNDYVGDNWHDSQITVPTILINLMLVMGNELPNDLVEKLQPIIGRANMSASGARPSGDRIVIAGILAKNMLFRENFAEFEKVIKIIEGEIKFSTGERGIQHDYSFHHRPDRVNNTTSYGYGKYANAFGEWLVYVNGTKYQFSKAKINQLVDYYIDGITKQLVYGIYEDVSVKNRDITSKNNFQPRGTLEIERLLVGTDYRKAELEELIRLRKGTAKPSKSFAKFFWQTEHFVFQRPNFYTTVRMFSTRNANMEMPYNGPGKPTHHRADGTNYLVLKGNEYHNIWPVYDWQKVSGTTVLQKPKLHGPEDIQKKGLTRFVGAVNDDLYGAVAFDFKSPHDMVEAKKSWFFFDEEYVCLGTDIRSESKLSVATTINQVLLKGDVAIMQDGNKSVLPSGNRVAEKVKWIYHDRIGYIFPEPTKINVSNQNETGTWASITDQKNISKEPVNEQVFKLWFDHGGRPTKAGYQYIVVPDVDQNKLMETSQNNRSIKILSNTDSVQAVLHGKLNMLQAAFYQAAELKVTPTFSLKMDSQGMAMVKMDGSRIKTISVADPSRQLSRMSITVSGIYAVKKEGLVCLPNNQLQQTILLINLPQGVYAGKSVNLQF
ncbi:MAG: polysaccharide lyase beta-sandwich domain-containing protein [Chitinophagaceae bacterium]|nr:polysaccharide lyase beta-sandwich domain-containing protein [Chitinophagaceae bacterium]